jgi:hypothetical protein
MPDTETVSWVTVCDRSDYSTAEVPATRLKSDRAFTTNLQACDPKHSKKARAYLRQDRQRMQREQAEYARQTAAYVRELRASLARLDNDAKLVVLAQMACRYQYDIGEEEIGKFSIVADMYERIYEPSPYLPEIYEYSLTGGSESGPSGTLNNICPRTSSGG